MGIGQSAFWLRLKNNFEQFSWMQITGSFLFYPAPFINLEKTFIYFFGWCWILQKTPLREV